jgi:hypothetical protein
MSAKSRSNAVREGPTHASAGNEIIGEAIAKETAEASRSQREEQMHQLAEIFAAIFETLQNEHEPAAAATKRAA